jgi:hypothetical protein
MVIASVSDKNQPRHGILIKIENHHPRLFGNGELLKLAANFWHRHRFGAEIFIFML